VISEEALQTLQARQRAAAAAEDYETAGRLRDLVAALRPSLPLTLDDCSPPTLESQVV
jgi:excinuclease UvrABC nuclease subunit